MVAIPFQMSHGFAGDITRHLFSVEPVAQLQTNPVPYPGLAVVIDQATGMARPPAAADTAIYGVAVRSFPGQEWSATNYGASPFGPVMLAPSQPLDVMRMGYMLVAVVGNPRKGDPVFVWVAASGGGHVNGGFEAAETVGSTIQLDSKTMWSTPADGNGLAEIGYNI